MADDSIYERNKQYVAPGEHEYKTDLGDKEPEFQAWVKQNNVPFDLNAEIPDYDMRGFYKALQEGDPKAQEALNPNDKQMHFPDYWKTPYHHSFSNESQWADPAKAPKWNEKDQLVLPDGTVTYDERAEAIQKQQEKQQKNIALMQALKALLQRVKQPTQQPVQQQVPQ
jgi:hypothetical protein